MPMTGTTLAHYRITGELGAGGDLVIGPDVLARALAGLPAEQRAVYMQAPQGPREFAERFGLAGYQALRVSQPHRRIRGTCP